MKMGDVVDLSFTCDVCGSRLRLRWTASATLPSVRCSHCGHQVEIDIRTDHVPAYCPACSELKAEA